MKFINTITKSLSDKHFYSHVAHEPSNNAWKFFIKSAILTGFIFVIIGIIELIPFFNFINDPGFVTKISSLYPNDLVLTMKSGKLSTNVEEPYSIPLSVFDAIFPNFSKGFLYDKNFLTIDTISDFSMANFENSKSVVYMTKDYLIYRDKNGTKIDSYSGFKDGQFNKQSFMVVVETVASIVRSSIKIIAIPVIILFIVFYLVQNIVFLTVATFIVWLIYKLAKKEKRFGQLFKQGLYLMFLIMVLDLLMLATGFHSLLVGFIVFLLLYYYLIGSNKING
jgi:hypothetical protein